MDIPFFVDDIAGNGCTNRMEKISLKMMTILKRLVS